MSFDIWRFLAETAIIAGGTAVVGCVILWIGLKLMGEI